MIECTAAAPVLSTRADVFDTLVIDKEGALWILTASGSRLPVNLPRVVTADGRDEVANQFASSLSMALDRDRATAIENRLVDLVDANGSSVTAVYSDGERVRVSAQVALPTGLARRALEALSFALAPGEYAELFQAYLPASPQSAKTSGQQWRILAQAILMKCGVGASVPAVATTDPTLLRLARRVGLKNISERMPPSTGPSPSTPHVLLALHLVAQDCRLSSSTEADLLLIVPIIAQLAATLARHDWLDYWTRLVPAAVEASNLPSRELLLGFAS